MKPPKPGKKSFRLLENTNIGETSCSFPQQLNVDPTVCSRLSYLGLTGAGLPVPGATPGSVPDGTGESGKPGEVGIKFLFE